MAELNADVFCMLEGLIASKTLLGWQEEIAADLCISGDGEGNFDLDEWVDYVGQEYHKSEYTKEQAIQFCQEFLPQYISQNKG